MRWHPPDGVGPGPPPARAARPDHRRPDHRARAQWSPAAAIAERRPSVGVGCRRPCRRAVVAGSSSVSRSAPGVGHRGLGAAIGVGRRRPSRLARDAAGVRDPVLPARHRFTPAELLHEVVDQVTHGGEYTRTDRSGQSSPGLLAGTRRGPSPPARSDASPSPGPAGIGGPARSRAGRATAGSHRRVGRSSPSRVWSFPVVLEGHPGERATDRRPTRASGSSSHGPTAGTTSRKLTTPSSSVTQTTATHPPSAPRSGGSSRVRRADGDRTGCSR